MAENGENPQAEADALTEQLKNIYKKSPIGTDTRAHGFDTWSKIKPEDNSKPQNLNEYRKSK